MIFLVLKQRVVTNTKSSIMPNDTVKFMVVAAHCDHRFDLTISLAVAVKRMDQVFY